MCVVCVHVCVCVLAYLGHADGLVCYRGDINVYRWFRKDFTCLQYTCKTHTESVYLTRRWCSSFVLLRRKVFLYDWSQLTAQIIAIKPLLPQWCSCVTHVVPVTLHDIISKSCDTHLSPSVSSCVLSLSTTSPTVFSRR